MRTGDESGSGSLHWAQRRNEYDLRLITPFSGGVYALSGADGAVSLRTPDNGLLRARNAESLLYQVAGWRFPVSELVFWIRGLPAPALQVDRLLLDDKKQAERVEPGRLVDTLQKVPRHQWHQHAVQAGSGKRTGARAPLRQRMEPEPMTPEPWPAPAKINHFLHVTGRRADGYHLLQTVFQFLDLADSLTFTATADGRIRCLRNYQQVEEQDDLVIRAAKLLQELGDSTMGAEISVDKRIPIGGGLGGGSSDAATTLVALNCLWGHRIDNRRDCRNRTAPGRGCAGIRARVRRLGRRRWGATRTRGTGGKLVFADLSQQAGRY